MKAIRLQRFKGFLDSGWIEFKPITLLFGYNSSGKSSILHSLLMLKQSLENPSLEVPFVFSSQKGVDLGSFEDTVYNHKINHDAPMIISLRVDIGEVSSRLKLKPLFLNSFNSSINNLEDTNIEYSMEISYNQKRRFISIIGFTIKDSSEKVFLRMKRTSVSQNPKSNFSSDYYPELNKVNNMEITWYNFLPIIKDPDFYNHPITEIVDALRAQIQISFANLNNIGPVRAIPERNQPFTGESPVTVGVQGEDAFKLLYLDRYRSVSKNLAANVNKWLSQYNYKFEWKIFKNSLGQFILIDTRSKVKVSIKDVGFGLSQILPIVIQVFDTSPKSTLLIEQPEIHLHPRAQAELADLFIESIYKDNNPKNEHGSGNLILETHSEHLLLRLRRRLAESYAKQINSNNATFSSEDIALYFVENIDGQSQVEKLQINNKGEFLNSTPSFKRFFTDDFEEVLEINSLLAEIKRDEARLEKD